MQYDDAQFKLDRTPREVVDFADLLPSSPGRLRGRERYATVRPAVGSTFIAQGATIVRRAGDLFHPDVEFTIHDGLTVAGPSVSSTVAYFRHIFRGGQLPCASAYTLVDELGSMQLDRLDGQFQGRRCSLRAPHAMRDSGTLLAVLEAPELSETETLALWLLLNFLSGNRLTTIAIEAYDAYGELISCTYRNGTPSSRSTTPPFDFRFVPANVDLFANAFVTMLEAGYPINHILHHLHDADGTAIDTDLQHLLLAVHASFEAWNRICGRRTWLPPDNWKSLQKIIVQAIKPIIAHLEQGQRDAIMGSISRSNDTSMGFRERDFFRSLAIKLMPKERAALEDRNELLHNGYFLHRFAQLDPEARQERYDKLGHLRNLLYLTIARIAGYSGPIHEYTRLASRQIESLGGPIPFRTSSP